MASWDLNDDTVIGRVLRDIGGQNTVTLEDLSCTKDEFIEWFILPTFEMYQKFHPQTYKESLPISANTVTEIAFPPDVFGVMSCKRIGRNVATTAMPASGTLASIISQITNVSGQSQFSGSYDDRVERSLVFQELQSLQNRLTIRVELAEQKMFVASRVNQTLEVRWMKYFKTYDKVYMGHKEEFCEVVKWFVLKYLHGQRNQTNNEESSQFNDAFVTEMMTKIEEGTLARWKEKALINVIISVVN